MRRVLVTVAAVVSLTAEAQSTEISSSGWGPKNSVTTGPLSMLPAIWRLGFVNLEWEHGLLPGLSFYVAPDVSFGTLPPGNLTGQGYSQFGFGGGAGVRFYPLARDVWGAPRGFFVGPGMHIGYSRLTLRPGSVDPVTYSGMNLSFGAQVGYTTFVRDAFAVSVGTGVGVGLAGVSVSGRADGPFFETGPYLVRFNVGYAF